MANVHHEAQECREGDRQRPYRGGGGETLVLLEKVVRFWLFQGVEVGHAVKKRGITIYHLSKLSYLLPLEHMEEGGWDKELASREGKEAEQAGPARCEGEPPSPLPSVDVEGTGPICQGLEQRWLLGRGRFHAVSSNWAPTVYSGCPRKRAQELQNKRKSVGAVTQSLQRSTHSSILT